MRNWKWLFACASVFIGVGHAGEARTWAPYGFVTYEDQLLNTRRHPDRPLGAQSFSSTPEGACAVYQSPRRPYCAPTGLSNSGFTGLGWCTENARRPSACSETDFWANMEENNTVAIFPACFPIPLTNDEIPRNIVGYIAADTTGLSCHCEVRPGVDPALAVPDSSSGYCVSPHRLGLTASRDRFVAGLAGEPVSIKVSVRKTDGSPAANEPVTLAVQPTSGVPGTLKIKEGKTNSSGVLMSEYTFP